MMRRFIYFWIGVKRPGVSPAELQELAATWDAVRRTAAASQAEVAATVGTVLLTNQGDATDAFHERITGSRSSLKQLEKLADAALETADAHAGAASAVMTAQTTMDAVATQAGRGVIDALQLEPALRVRRLQEIRRTARAQLTLLSIQANATVTALYASISLPSLMSLSEAQTRGNVPDELEEMWSSMSYEDQRKLLEAIAEDILEDWDEGDRPPVVFYSVNNADPPDVVEQDDEDWEGYRGVAYDGKVWLNNDLVEGSPQLLSTMVHEIQHIKQGHLRDRYDQLVAADPDLVADVRAGRRADPFIADGSTVDEVERFRAPYMNTNDPEQGPFYTHQPVEMDARRSGTEYLDHLTPEKVQELLDR